MARRCLESLGEKLLCPSEFSGPSRLCLVTSESIASVCYQEAEFVVSDKHSYSGVREVAEILNCATRTATISSMHIDNVVENLPVLSTHYRRVIEEACVEADGIRERLFTVERALVPSFHSYRIIRKDTMRLWFNFQDSTKMFLDVHYDLARVMFKVYVNGALVQTCKDSVAAFINNMIACRTQGGSN